MLTEQERIDIVQYRINNANKTLAEVRDHIQHGYFNTATNRMYYACYYAASAMLIANQISAKSHEGVKQMFGLHFVRTGVFPQYIGKYYGQLFDERNTGDYEDFFDHDETSTKDLYAKAEEIITLITAKVNTWLSEQSEKTDNK